MNGDRVVAKILKAEGVELAPDEEEKQLLLDEP